MKVRVVTMRHDDALQGFPEEALKKAQFGHEVIDVREHFYIHAGVPYLALVMCLADDVETRGSEESPGFTEAGKIKRKGPDFYMMLPEDRRQLFADIRKWRNEKAAGKFPPYVICRNSTMAELAYRVPKTISALGAVAGCGESFCEKYGEELVGLLKACALESAELPEEFVKAKAAEEERGDGRGKRKG